MSTINPDTGLEGFEGWEATARGIICERDPSHGPRGARMYRTKDGVICEWCIAVLVDALIELQVLGDMLGVPRPAQRFGGEDMGRVPTGAEVIADLRKWTSGSRTEERRQPGRIVDLAVERSHRGKARGVKPGDRDGAD